MLTREFVYSANHTHRGLYVKVLGGLCNRIRVIASGRKAAALMNTKLTIIWGPTPDAPVPEWDKFFAPMDGVTFVTERPKEDVWDSMSEFKVWDSYKAYQDLTTYPFMPNLVASCHAFSFRGHPPFTMKDLIKYMPPPSDAVREAFVKFWTTLIDPDNDSDHPIVGVHVRSTDLLTSRKYTPPEVMFPEIERLLTGGARVLLATDSPAMRDLYLERFPELIILPKADFTTDRWPRPANPDSVVEDWIELLCLGACDYVLGSYQSSYSATAFALNGDLEHCRFVATPDAPPDPYLIPNA